MGKVMRRMLLILNLVVLTASSSGCFTLLVGAAAGAGGYAWVKGGLVKEFEVPAEKLSSAAMRAVKQLGLPLEDEKTDRLSGYIRSKTADNQTVVIQVKALTEKKSQLTIRVGFWGNQAKSEMILNGVKKNL